MHCACAEPHIDVTSETIVEGLPVASVSVTIPEGDQHDDEHEGDTASVTSGHDCAHPKRPTISIVDDENLDPDALRSVRLSKTLARVGYAWRVRPTAHTAKVNMYALSELASSVDYFLSHSWASSGWSKYLSLLLRFHWLAGTIAALMSVVVVFPLEVFGVLPEVTVYDEYHAQLVDYHASFPLGCWCLLVSPFLAVLGLVLSPTISQTFRVLHRIDSHVFLDQVCIDQEDPLKKQEGIRSLGWVLRHSRALIVLWTPQYFSRLWCVFEIAAFRKMANDGTIIFQPVFMDVSLYLYYVVVWVGSLLSAVFTWSLGHTRAPIAIFLGSFVISSLSIGSARKSMRSKKMLDTQIADFDCRSAKCHLSSDKEFILGNICEWYGSADNFNRTVRTDLCADIQATVRADRLTYGFCVAANWPICCQSLDFNAALIRAGAPTVLIMHHTLYMIGISLLFQPILCYTFFKVAEQTSRKRETRVAEMALNIAAGFLVALFVCLGIGTWLVMYKLNALGNVIITVLWAGLAAYVFFVGRLGAPARRPP